MATRRKGGSRGRGASRGRQGAPAWLWLLGGMLIGLGLAWYLFGKGYIPQPQRGETGQSAAVESEMLPRTEEAAPRKEDEARPRYDFFTVLPEMEVVVPEQDVRIRHWNRG